MVDNLSFFPPTHTHTYTTLLYNRCVFVFLVDDIRRRHARLHQSAEEQIPLQKVLRQASSAGLLTRADGSRRRQHGNVSHHWASLIKRLEVWLLYSTNPPLDKAAAAGTGDSRTCKMFISSRARASGRLISPHHLHYQLQPQPVTVSTNR